MGILSVGLERILYHFALVPMVGVVGSWAIGWHWLVFFGIDAALSIAYEVVRVGVLGVTIGIKDVIPVLIYFRVEFPRPTLAAAIVSAVVLAGLVAWAVGYLLRRRTRPAVHTGRYWRRPGLALAAAMAAAMVGLFAAGVALMAPAVGPFLALPAVPFGWLAYNLQTPPRRGGSRVGESGRTMIPLPAVLTPSRDQTAQTVLVGGVR